MRSFPRERISRYRPGTGRHSEKRRISVIYADGRREVLPVNATQAIPPGLGSSCEMSDRHFATASNSTTVLGLSFRSRRKSCRHCPPFVSRKFIPVTWIRGRWKCQTVIWRFLPGGRLRLQGESTNPSNPPSRTQGSREEGSDEYHRPGPSFRQIELPLPDAGLTALSIHLENRDGDVS